MLQQDEPEDFVLATGETHPIKEYIEKAFKVAEIELRFVDRLPFSFSSLSTSFPRADSFSRFLFVHVDRWEGEGVDEIAYDVKTNKPVVKIDEK